MTVTWMRRALALGLCLSAALLAGCGSSSIESQLRPARVIAFGDSFSDLGQSGTRYTVNDGSINVWAQQVATSYGSTLASAASGGTSYAQGHARVNTKPDSAGSSSTKTIAEQVTTFLGSSTVGGTDLVLVNGGITDVIAEMSAVAAGTRTSDQALANVQQAGRDLGAQVRRLVAAGAKYVAVAGTYDLSRSLWGVALNTATPGQGATLSTLSGKFNEAFLVSVVDLGANVLYLDAAFYFNLVTSTPTGYSLSNGTDPVCTSVDAGAGIGTGPGQVNSGLCTTGTLVSGADYSKYLFADRVYFTPVVNRLFGTRAYDLIRARW